MWYQKATSIAGIASRMPTGTTVLSKGYLGASGNKNIHNT
jgi:hypothetical protein